MSLLALMPIGLKQPLGRFIKLASLSIATALGGCATTSSLSTVDQIPALMAAYDVDGLAVTAVAGDEILFSEGFGVTSDGTAYNASSSCGLYSATKMLASLTYANLAQDGRIDLNAPLSDYIADVPADWSAIPFYRLLNHTSGITMAVNKPEFGALMADPTSENKDIYQMVKDAPLDYQPGEYSRYRQSGYAVAEMILKDRLDADFDTLIDQYITVPAGMTETGHPSRTEENEPSFLMSAGGYRTTANDMARLFLSLNSGAILQPADWKNLLLDDSYLFDDYSLGSIRENKNGILTLGHRGGGARANIRYAPDEEVGVMVCTDDIQNNELAITLARMLIDDITSGEAPLTPIRVALSGHKDMTGAEIVAAYRAAADQTNRYDLSGSEAMLNRIGYGLLGQERTADAVEVFSLNAETFPQSANAHDSLGEALLASGDRDAALAAYQKVLDLDPGNANAKTMTDKISTMPDTANLKALADSYAENWGFNGTVLMARGGEILVEESYGEADIEWDVPNSASTRYGMGSLSKPFAATLIMNLIEDDVLSLDGTLGEYLPDLYAGTPVASVTVSQLLSHTSGITDVPRDLNGTWWNTIGRQTFVPETFAKEWIKPVLTSEPGARFQYNNAGFILLGVIVERVTGQSYADVIDERVFKPADMTSSGVLTSTEIVKNLAHGYIRTPEGGLLQAPAADPSVLSAAGSLYATVQDIYRFDRALYGNDLVSEDSRKLMMTIKAEAPYGFGWAVQNWTLADGSSLSVKSHTGSVPGYQANYLRSEDTETTVILISNNNQGFVGSMGPDLMRALNGNPIKLAKRNLQDLLGPVSYNEGEAAAIATYKSLGNKRAEYDLREGPLNRLGYGFLRRDMKDAAILFLELGAELYPESANTHDSLGEAYRAAGRMDEAIASYEKALAVTPDFPSAVAALEEMRTGGK